MPRVYSITDSFRAIYNLPGDYVLVIARLEPENRIDKIINTYLNINEPKFKLIILGALSMPYFKNILSKVKNTDIIFLGSVFDQKVLNILRSSCIAYIHGHTVDGTSPTILDALAAVIGKIICHDNKYNREFFNGESLYFSNINHLSKILQVLNNNNTLKTRVPIRDLKF